MKQPESMTKRHYALLFLIASHGERGERGIPAFQFHRFKPSSKRAANWLINHGFAKFEGGKLVATSIGYDKVESEE